MAFENKGAMTATIVVAASDSLNKAAANYVCDGTADNVEIQAAIDALPATGGRVVLLEGNYSIAAAIELLSNTDLVGCGWGTVLKSTAADNVIEIFGTDIAHKQFCQVHNLAVDGDDVGLVGVIFGYADYITISDLYIKDTTADCIRNNGGTIDTIVQSCYTAGSGEDGIHTRTVNGDVLRHAIINCHSWANTFDAIAVNALNTMAGDVLGISIIGCHSYGNGGHGVDFKGAGTAGGGTSHYIRKAIIKDNTCYNNTSGIYVDGLGQFGITEVIIEGNTVHLTTTSNPGIRIDECKNISIIDNIVSETQQNDGITINDSQDIIVEGNHSYQNARNGINIVNSPNITIKGNICKNNDQTATTKAGICLQSAGTVNCIVEGNICTDDQGVKTQDYGIWEVSSADYNTFKNNVTRDNGTLGMTIAGGGHSTFDRMEKSTILDLSGAATDVVAFHTECPCVLAGYTILYTEASSADAGVNVRIGRYQDGVALDDDYFDISVSEISKNLGYSKTFVTASLTQKVIAAGDTITVGTAGGKVGTGEVLIILHIAEMAS